MQYPKEAFQQLVDSKILPKWDENLQKFHLAGSFLTEEFFAKQPKKLKPYLMLMEN
jgi:hypothetical protein